MFFIGIFAFALFFLSDFNDLYIHSKALVFCFPAGVVMLAASSVALAIRGISLLPSGIRIIFAVFAVVFFILEIYSLFFALPVGDSYSQPGKKRTAMTTGVYALCRHPGVLWFAVMFFCLCPAFDFPIYAALTFSLLDILLAFFEDTVVFPRLIEDYDSYRSTTPFLLPNADSVRRFGSYFN